MSVSAALAASRNESAPRARILGLFRRHEWRELGRELGAAVGRRRKAVRRWRRGGASARSLSPQLLRRSLEPHLGRGRLWIAYSGGLDSSVLLHAASICFGQRTGGQAVLADSSTEPSAVDARHSPELCAIHVDHGLNPQSAGWAEHCRTQAARIRVPLTERSLWLSRQKGESLEAVARSARYAAFADLLGPGDVLATAQHRDDQAETLLLALLRGSGLQGLAAMPVTAELGAGRLLRPLLGFSRTELLDYAEREGIAWIDDPSNADVGLDRNLLRHHVIPQLRRRWPSLDLTVARSASHCAEAAGLLDEAADEWLAQARRATAQNLVGGQAARTAGGALPTGHPPLAYARRLSPAGERGAESDHDGGPWRGPGTGAAGRLAGLRKKCGATAATCMHSRRCRHCPIQAPARR